MNITADLRQHYQLGTLRLILYSAYLDRSLEFKQDRLGDEDLASLSTQVSYLCLEQLNLLPWATAANLQESVYDGVEIDVILVRHDRRLVK